MYYIYKHSRHWIISKHVVFLFLVLSEPILARLKFHGLVEAVPVVEVGTVMKRLNVSIPPAQDISDNNLTLIKMSPKLKGKRIYKQMYVSPRCLWWLWVWASTRCYRVVPTRWEHFWLKTQI